MSVAGRIFPDYALSAAPAVQRSAIYRSMAETLAKLHSLDWELSTLGHPLADLAFNVLAWRTAADEYGGLLGLDLEALGIPQESTYLDTYYAAMRTGTRLQPFHYVFALFRFAVIFEGIAARARGGNAAADNAAEVARLGPAFARRARQIMETGG